MRDMLLTFGLVFCLSETATAGPVEQAMLKLGPEERAHQACVIKGIDELRRGKRLPQADRLKTGIFKPAAFDGTVVAAAGGAVRAKDHWYALKFTCAVTPDQMKATSFTYELGAEIPEAKWDELGLWK
jgi:hypothetical protein